MSEQLTRIHEKRNRAWESAKSILDKADAEGRDLTAEESEAYQRTQDDMSALDSRAAQIIEAEKRDAEIAEYMREHELDPVGTRSAETPVMDEVRAFLRGERRDVAIAKDANFRDLLKSTDATGGATVPKTFYAQLVEHMVEVSGLLQGGPTMIETSSGESIDIPVTTAFSTASMVAESAAIPESDPAFAKRTLGAYKFAVLTQVSRELIDDSAFDLQGFLARQGGRGCGNALGAQLITGTGSNAPAGIATQATMGVTGGTGVTGGFTADNLIDLFYSVISPYRASASAAWLMRDMTLASVRKLKDTTGQYLWQPALTAGAPDLLLGKPVHTDPNVAPVGTGAKSVLFGDISAYFVRLAGGVRFERSDDFAFANDLVTFKTVVRGDGLLADQAGAVKCFVGGAS